MLLLVLLLAAALAPAREPLRIIASGIPPLSFTRDGAITGYCVELIRELQRRVGDTTHIELMPWARAYRMGMDGANVVLLCPKRTPEREPRFKWVGPVLESESMFYALRRSRIHLSSLNEARALEGILVPRDFYSYQYLRDAGFTNLEPVNSSQTMLAMLLAGRRPVMVLDREQLPALLEQAGADADQVEPVLKLMSIQSYFTFALDAPDSQVAQWQQALDRMKRDGALARLQRQWFPDGTALLPRR
ncbi:MULTISPECIES: ABC transporter substrate-binding protein [unclassified Duganella]|uniref:substrate-binding periplasmic protein n=1 Tax=unclassified Duganella TaxID=2636909 RepID=UPI0013EE794B|nr:MULTISPECIES: transporter substrate-binding domain-containing protein [unclassified Duganella]